jgi:hypothetical protein
MNIKAIAVILIVITATMALVSTSTTSIIQKAFAKPVYDNQFSIQLIRDIQNTQLPRCAC